MFEPKRDRERESNRKLKTILKSRASWFVLVLLKLNHIKEIKTDEERDTRGVNEISAQDFDGGKLYERDHLGHLGIDGRIIGY
jgi:hypothetical protein